MMRGSRQRRLIAFDSGHLNLRGTDVALYDYADYAETLLGHRSLILAPSDSDLSALDRFRQRFSVCLYKTPEDRTSLIQDCDLYYHQVYGDRPTDLPPKPPRGKRAIHCVFTAHQPYGEVYAGISEWVSRERGPAVAHESRPPIPTVPYMVHLPENQEDLRLALGIPADDVVLGRHGGPHTFNLPWVRETVAAAMEHRGDLHLIFLNTDRFIDHPRVHFLAGTHDLEDKRVFINTCDAMLHARAEGETFGLAVAEFSVCNKPVITWSGGTDRYHIEVLGDKGIYYDAPRDLLDLLMHWQPDRSRDWDAFSSRFSPARVMEQFSRVFLGQECDLRNDAALRTRHVHTH